MHEKNKREMVYVEKKIPSIIFLLPWFESSGPVPLYPIESGANETTFAFEPLVVFEKREEEKTCYFEIDHKFWSVQGVKKKSK